MTRIERARRRVAVARYAIGGSALAAFALFVAAARASHPGTHHARRTNGVPAATSSDESSAFFDGSSSAIGPAGSALPQVQSGAS
jgi:hypothetical protein